ncbi:hypothetical protein Tco_1479294, partial [Tanacetum coccineum]
LRLNANVVRFERVHINNASQPKNNASQPYNPHVESVKNLGADKGSFADVLNSGRAYPSNSAVTFPAIVLDDACLMERDFSSSLMEKIKDINAMPNMYLILANEGFDNVKITHLGGMWVLLDMKSTAVKDKILNHVGVRSWLMKLQPAFTPLCVMNLTDVDEPESNSLSSKRLCVKVKSNVIINDKIKIIVKGKIFWILAKELETWSPKFKEANDDDSSSEDESVDEEKENKSENIENDFELENDNDLDHVSESSCMHENENDLVSKNVSKGTNHSNKSDDPFGIYNILKRHNDKEASASLDPKFPPGFTPTKDVENAMEANLEMVPKPKDDVIDTNKDTNSAISGYNDVLKLKP